MLAVGPVISELMASNDGTLADEDGNPSDWIEIHNPTAGPLDLDGWHLTDDATNLTRWAFPDVTVQPGGYMLVFASGNNRTDPNSELHTNFQLDGDGEYLALVEPGGTVAHAYDFYPQQFTDVSYGLGQDIEQFVAAGDPIRYRVPTTGNNAWGTDWTEVGFNDSTFSGTASTITGIGYQAGSQFSESFDTNVTPFPGGAYPQWSTVLDGNDTAFVSGGMLHIQNLSGVANSRAVITDVPDGGFRLNAGVGSLSGGVGSFNVGLVIGNAKIVFHPGYGGGAFRFGRNDDSNITSNQNIGFTPATGVLHEFEVEVTPNGGNWNVDVTITDGNNPANVFTTSQTLSAADVGATIDQVGVTRSGWSGGDGIYDDLTILESGTPEGFDPNLIQTDVESSMLGQNASIYLRQPFDVDPTDQFDRLTLRMQYDDGFIAYLNGTPVAQRNAPVSPAYNSEATVARANDQVGLFEEIDISAHLNLLVPGENVLAVHGLNVSASDDDFLIATELTAEAAPQSSQLYFLDPTPGAANGEGFEGLIQTEVAFSQPGGSFTDSFLLQLTPDTPGATIYYTLDGSVPTETSAVYSAPIAIDTTTHVRARVLQHGMAPGPIHGESYLHLGADVQGFSSSLPLMVIENFTGGLIPNKGWSADGSGVTQVPRQAAVMSLFEPAGGESSLAAAADLTTRIGIRVRGAFSSSFAHPAYSVEAWDENDQERAITPFGMPKESDWILYGPNSSYDKTMLSNTFIFELSNEIGQYAVRTQFVEAFIHTDGGSLSMNDHAGVYVLMEKVKRDENRIDFEPLSEDGTQGGWMIDINRIDAQPIGGGVPQHFHTAGRNRVLQTPPNQSGVGDDEPQQWNAFFNFSSPGGYEINPVQRATIEDWFVEFEDALYGPDFADPEIGYAKYLDVDSFIDYFILHNITKNGDGLLISMWAYKQSPTEKLKMGPVWDYDLAYDVSGSATNDLKKNAGRLWYGRLFEDPEFQQRYLDRWQELRRGELSTANIEAIIDRQAAEITNEVAVRHGIGNWVARLDSMKNWLGSRVNAIDGQFVSGVQFDQQSGYISPGFVLGMTAPAGSIYYTTDGTDPRVSGGGISPNALLYTGPITLDDTAQVIARALNAGQWSGATKGTFSIVPLAATGNLAITELNYNPPDPTPAEIAAGFLNNDDFEFVELQNIGGTPINLTGSRFVELPEGIQFDFTGSGLIELSPGEFVVLVRSSDAFEFRYGASHNVAGQYFGGLSNGGERIILKDLLGGLILDFAYGDSKAAGWPDRADGNGSSLEVIDRSGDYNDPANWRSSSEYLGTPGAAGLGPYDGIVVNEILSHSDDPLVDAIELYNPTDTDVVLDGWWLSDDSDDFFKFQIPTNTTIPAYGYVTFYEGHYQGQTFTVDQQTEFGGTGAKDFALSGSRGDDVWLLMDPGDGTSLRFVDHVEFGGALQGESFGRWPDGTGDLYPMTNFTPDEENSGPRSPQEVVISEVMYNPSGDDIPDHLEFIEIYNATAGPVNLTGWRLRKGFDYDFAPGTMLDAQQALVIVSFDPGDSVKLDAFRAEYAIGSEVVVLGNPNDTLSDTGERIQLQRPDTPPPDDPLYVPHVIEDEVDYLNTWHSTTNGQGESLNRSSRIAWGNDPASWSAESPTPGEVSSMETGGVAGRYVFYNNSTYDNEAIAADKTALRPGEQASLANYTSYVRGINGIIIDVFGLADPEAIDATDFTFKLGNDDTPANWSDAPTPSIDVVFGPDDSDRILLTWADNAITNTWLEVSLLVTGNTGLAAADVFYFGNLVGECTGDGKVDAYDVLEVRNNPRPFFDPALLDTLHDFNRDRRVNAIDTLIARNNQTWSATELQLLDLSTAKAFTSSKADGTMANRGKKVVHDAVLGLAANRDIASGKTSWLYQFEQISKKDRPDREGPFVKAVDRLLATTGP